MRNVEHSFSSLPVRDEAVQTSLTHILNEFDAAMKALKDEIEKLTKANFSQELVRLTSVVGISTTIATH